MTFSKVEMYDMLVEYADISTDTIDIVVKILGDVPQTYIKILKARTNFKSFLELEEYGEQKWDS